MRGGFFVPDVASLLPIDRAAGAFDDENFFDDSLGLLDRRIDIGLERDLLAAANALIRGDQDFRAAIADASGKRIGREAAEDDGMDGADARASEHGISRLGDHRHIDRDRVALLDALRLQHIGEAADMIVQFAIGDMERLVRIVAFPDDRRLVAAGFEMTVEAVHRDIGDAILIPFDRDPARTEGRVLHLGEGLDPIDARAPLFAPKAVGIIDRMGIELGIFCRVDIGSFRPLGTDGIDFIRHGFLPRSHARRASFLPPMTFSLCAGGFVRNKRKNYNKLVEEQSAARGFRCSGDAESVKNSRRAGPRRHRPDGRRPE